MADGDNPIRPRPPLPPPGQPLPRVWKAEAEAEAEPPPRDRRARIAAEKAEKEARAEAEKPGGKAKSKREPDRKSSKETPKPKRKGVLLEETPELDTYESRQRVRLLIGGGIAAAVLIAGIVLYNSLPGSTFDETDLVDEGGSSGGSPAAVSTAPPGPSKAEQEATNLLGTARQFAKNGKVNEATAVLQRVTKSYPKTRAATLAKEAIARPSQNQPLFLDEEMIVATRVANPKPGEAQVVNAVDANASIVPPGQPGNATLELNPNPSESPRAPSGGSSTKAAVAARPLPAGFRIEDESGIHKSGWPYQIVSDRDGAVMVLVPAGTYSQGRDDGAPDEGPSHKVRLSAFYIDQHEVTNRQFEFYLKETGHRRSTRADGSAKLVDEEPVTNVTALEATNYCEWAGKRLPTEAQWEAAARSTEARIHPWGSSEPVWSRPRLPRQIDPVGAYPLDQSACGALDLAGNAWEWTKDWFDPKYYQQFQGQVADEPAGPVASRSKPPQVVVKGGSKLWVAAWREGMKPESKFPYVGFRGVLAVESKGPSTQPAAPPTSAPTAKPARPPANASGVVPF